MPLVRAFGEFDAKEVSTSFTRGHLEEVDPKSPMGQLLVEHKKKRPRQLSQISFGVQPSSKSWNDESFFKGFPPSMATWSLCSKSGTRQKASSIRPSRSTTKTSWRRI